MFILSYVGVSGGFFLGYLLNGVRFLYFGITKIFEIHLHPDGCTIALRKITMFLILKANNSKFPFPTNFSDVVILMAH